jgi:fructose-bisphosphate aldolase class II
LNIIISNYDQNYISLPNEFLTFFKTYTVMSERISTQVKPGVVSGKDLQIIFDFAKKGKFALPAVNVVGTNSVNGVMEAAKTVNSPVIIQFSNGGAIFYAGKSLKNEAERAAIQGA